MLTVECSMSRHGPPSSLPITTTPRVPSLPRCSSCTCYNLYSFLVEGLSWHPFIEPELDKPLHFVVSFSIFIVVATPFCQLSLELFEYCFQIFNVRTHVTIYTKHFYFVNIHEKLVVWSRDTWYHKIIYLAMSIYINVYFACRVASTLVDYIKWSPSSYACSVGLKFPKREKRQTPCIWWLCVFLDKYDGYACGHVAVVHVNAREPGH